MSWSIFPSQYASRTAADADREYFRPLSNPECEREIISAICKEMNRLGRELTNEEEGAIRIPIQEKYQRYLLSPGAPSSSHVGTIGSAVSAITGTQTAASGLPLVQIPSPESDLLDEPKIELSRYQQLSQCLADAKKYVVAALAIATIAVATIGTLALRR